MKAKMQLAFCALTLLLLLAACSVQPEEIDPYSWLREAEPDKAQQEMRSFVSGDYAYTLSEDGTAGIAQYIGGDLYVSVPSVIDGHIVMRINGYAFADCDFIESVAIPETVTEIGDYAFCGCENLSDVAIPDSINHIGKNPFLKCSGLLSWNISKDHAYLANADGVLVTKTDHRLVSYRRGRIASNYTVPDDIRIIGDHAFFGSYNLKSVRIPESVTGIGANPFACCDILSAIRITDDHPCLTLVDGVLFYKPDNRLVCCINRKLQSYTVPQGTEIIDDYAFHGTYSLNSITLPDSVTSIGDHCFADNINIQSVELPGSLTHIGNYAFCGCSGLKSITIPDGVVSIGDHAFEYCISLTHMTIPAGVSELGANPFARCDKLYAVNVSADNPALAVIDGALFSKPDKRLVQYCGSAEIHEYRIPDGIEIIDDYAFSTPFRNYVTGIVIPDSVRRIGKGAFAGCRKLSGIVIPDGVIEICDKTFYSCGSISVSMPRSVRRIGNEAFAGADIVSITIPYGVTRIGVSAFQQCRGLTGVSVPGSVRSIGKRAFFECTGMQSLSLEEGVALIEQEAFKGCIRLSTIKIPGSVVSIGDSAFMSCRNVLHLWICDGVERIGIRAFSGCSDLYAVVLPASITMIGERAFDQRSFRNGERDYIFWVQPDSYAQRFCVKNNYTHVTQYSYQWFSWMKE